MNSTHQPDTHSRRPSIPQAPQDRRQVIAEHVIARGSVRVENLARAVGVSAMTIYRDVANLEQAGIVHLDRGLVRAVATSLSEADAEFRLQQSPRIKQAMAEALVPRIAQGSSVMLDDSTSAMWVLRALRDVHPLTVITTSLLVANEAKQMDGVRLLMAGGEYEPWAHAMMGPTAAANLRAWQADHCVMSASGIVGKRCQHPYENAVQVKQAMIASSTNRYLLLDHTKFARKALYTFAEITDFDAVVVDAATPREIRDELAGHGVEVIVSE
ncbi:DeoR/GlpR family DNA-binding transcription regulator [Arachnia propionica]|uniref:DeoR/GlpR family DNA-binding transcription regulator n=1 Tax=Arachnia propionica TaxID=1750 RepID=UPI00398FC356